MTRIERNKQKEMTIAADESQQTNYAKYKPQQYTIQSDHFGTMRDIIRAHFPLSTVRHKRPHQRPHKDNVCRLRTVPLQGKNR